MGPAVSNCTRATRRTRWAVMMLLALFAAACGGDESDGRGAVSTAAAVTTVAPVTTDAPAPTNSAAETTETKTTELTTAAPTTEATGQLPDFPRDKVSIIIPALAITSWPTLIAKEMGYFDRFNLDVDLPFVAGGATSVAAMISGDGDFTTVVGPALAAASQGQQLQFTCVMYKGSFSQLVLSSDAAAKLSVTATGSVAERALALKGLTLAAISQTSATHLESQTAFESAGGEGELNWVYMEQTAMAAALTAGAIDGFAAGTVTVQPVIDDGTAVPWLSGPGGDFAELDPQLAGFPAAPLVALKDTMHRPNELAARVTAAHLMVAELIKTDPDSALAALKRSPLMKDQLNSVDVSWNAEKHAMTDPILVPADLDVAIELQLKGNPDVDLSNLDTTALIASDVYERAAELAELAMHA